MSALCDRRELLGAAGAAMAAAWAGPIKLPASIDRVIPAPVRGLIPGEAGDLADLVAQLIGLEEEAKALRLPASTLAFGKGGVPSDLGRLYEEAMPRLVALIDQADRRAPFLADKAAALLARLHRLEYVAPQLWFAPSLETAVPGLDLPAPRTRIALPLEADDPDVLSVPQLPDPSINAPISEAAPLPLPAELPPVNPSHAYAVIADEYAAWFAAAQIRPEHQASADWHLTMMRESRPRYQALGKHVSVPWQFVAAIHGLEASFNFRAHMHNGDYPLSQRTRQVPAGRPKAWLPPSSWEASALDAMRLMGFAGQSDWSLPRMLYRLEAYNGFGYRHAKRASPYLWSFSTLYTRGKFVADGRYDPNARSKQCGAAVMLKVLDLAGELD